jgi:hypothetical protein
MVMWRTTMTLATAGIGLLSAAGLAGAEQVSRVVLGGEVGQAAATSTARFRFAPFTSLPWLRADLTGERVSGEDDNFHHVMRRPFKHYSGDISGRFIEIMARSSHGDPGVHPAFAPLLEEVVRHQRPGGYFCATGEIDWQQPLDFVKQGDEFEVGRMLPALWGNSRMLCGLVEAMRAFPGNEDTARSARALGDFYISMLPRFNDPARIAEYNGAGTYAAGHVTCWFPAMEGLVQLSALTGEKKYLEAAREIATFYTRFDHLPIDHAHGMLCNQVSLLLLHEATGNPDDLARVERRWEELVEGGYVNPAGGILEKCHVSFARDEGCAIADWLRLNLALGRITGKSRYGAMAERTLHNHFLQNQGPKGGFGHRYVSCDDEGVYGFQTRYSESTWCCSYHGELGFIELKRHLFSRDEGTLTCPFALDFTVTDAIGTTTSMLRPGRRGKGEVMRQWISLAGQPPTVVRVRQPHWADTVSAMHADGGTLEFKVEEGWCTTVEPVTEVGFIFRGAPYAEDRRCRRLPDGPREGQAFVIGYGPKIMALQASPGDGPKWPVTVENLGEQGLEPIGPAERTRSFEFVFGRQP